MLVGKFEFRERIDDQLKQCVEANSIFLVDVGKGQVTFDNRHDGDITWEDYLDCILRLIGLARGKFNLTGLMYDLDDGYPRAIFSVVDNDLYVWDTAEYDDIAFDLHELHRKKLEEDAEPRLPKKRCYKGGNCHYSNL
jgi:hypothetical protein